MIALTTERGDIRATELTHSERLAPSVLLLKLIDAASLLWLAARRIQQGDNPLKPGSLARLQRLPVALKKAIEGAPTHLECNGNTATSINSEAYDPDTAQQLAEVSYEQIRQLVWYVECKETWADLGPKGKARALAVIQELEGAITSLTTT